MGTRSRILLVRKNAKDVYLWQHWDGYLEGVGSDVCDEIKRLLQIYSTSQLQELIEGIEEGLETFSTQKLKDVIENNIKVEYDECDDIEYEYTINIYEEYLGVSLSKSWLIKLPLELIKQGYKFTDICIQKTEK